MRRPILVFLSVSFGLIATFIAAAELTTKIDPHTMANPNSTLTLNGASFPVGYQGSLSTLMLPSSLLSAPGISISADQIKITAHNFVLRNIDFRGYHVVVEANNVTITNCLADSAGYFTVQQPLGHDGLTVSFTSFIGTKSPWENDDFIFSDGVAQIHNNVFMYSGVDGIWLSGGSIDHNYIGPGGYTPGGHADGITVAVTRGMPVAIQYNYIDWTTPPDARTGANNAINFDADGGNINGLMIANNVLLGGGYTIAGGPPNGSVTLANVVIENNQIGNWYWGPLNSPLQAPALTWRNNVDVNTGAMVSRH
jgi:hypothetical protein